MISYVEILPVMKMLLQGHVEILPITMLKFYPGMLKFFPEMVKN